MQYQFISTAKYLNNFTLLLRAVYTQDNKIIIHISIIISTLHRFQDRLGDIKIINFYMKEILNKLLSNSKGLKENTYISIDVEFLFKIN